MAGFLLFVICLTWILLRVFPLDESANNESTAKPPARSGRNHDAVASHATASDRKRSIRVKELERLKQRWLDLGPGKDREAERDSLAKECVQALLCSWEMIELLQFFQEHEIDPTKIWEALRSLGEGSLGPMLRNSLAIAAAVDVGDDKIRGVKTLRYMCHFFAAFCPDADFPEFLAALRTASERCAQEAVFSHNEQLIKTKPVEALRSTLDEIARGVNPTFAAYALDGVFLNLTAKEWELPEFALVEGELNKLLRSDDKLPADLIKSVNRSRYQVYLQWAARDLDSATSIALKCPEADAIYLMKAVGQNAYDGKNPERTINWLNQLPEGQYRNAAADGVILSYKKADPNFCRSVVEYLNDPVLKAETLRKLDIFEGKIENSDPY